MRSLVAAPWHHMLRVSRHRGDLAQTGPQPVLFPTSHWCNPHADGCLCRGIAIWMALVCYGLPFAAQGFDFESVANRARQLAATAPKPGDANLPKELQDLTYDQLRDIRFRQDKAMWRDAKLPFELAFFHLGSHFDHPVKINELVGDTSRELRFDA